MAHGACVFAIEYALIGPTMPMLNNEPGTRPQAPALWDSQMKGSET